jgi:hypothetical protein
MSLRERAAPRLGIIEPCLPSPAKAPPSGPGWLHEIKHDGFRILARKDSAGVRLITRAGNDFSFRFPVAAEAVAALPAQSFLIDGEMIVGASAATQATPSSPKCRPAEKLRALPMRGAFSFQAARPWAGELCCSDCLASRSYRSASSMSGSRAGLSNVSRLAIRKQIAAFSLRLFMTMPICGLVRNF